MGSWRVLRRPSLLEGIEAWRPEDEGGPPNRRRFPGPGAEPISRSRAERRGGDTIESMDDGGTWPRRDDAGFEDPAERTSGISLETCYRHPQVTTGVHCTRCGRAICTDCMRPAAVGYQCPDDLAEASRSMPRGRSLLTIGRMGSVTRALLVLNIAIVVLELPARGQASAPSN